MGCDWGLVDLEDVVEGWCADDCWAVGDVEGGALGQEEEECVPRNEEEVDDVYNGSVEVDEDVEESVEEFGV